MSGYLQMNEEAKEKLQTLWERIEELNLNVGLSESTMKELKAKISSGIAANRWCN